MEEAKKVKGQSDRNQGNKSEQTDIHLTESRLVLCQSLFPRSHVFPLTTGT